MEEDAVTPPAKKRFYSDVYGHVGAVMQLAPNGTNILEVWMCGLCQVTGIPKKWKTRNTSNFRKHLLKHRPDEYAVLTDGASDGSASHGVFTSKDQDEAIELLLKWIVGDNFPFLVVDQERFREFCAKLNPTFQLPSRKMTRNYILARWDEAKAAVRDNLKRELGFQRVCLTTDAWTSAAQRGYIVVTLHFITEEWQMQSVIAGFVRVEYPHSGLRLASHIMDAVSELDPKLLPRIWVITTDNATNNATMISSVNVILRAHRAILTPSRDPIESLHGVFQVRCAGHVLQLAVREGLKECPLVDTAIGDLRDVVKKIRDSPKLTEKFQEACEAVGMKYLKVKLDVDTRWNSTWMMVERLLSVKRGVTKLMHCIKSNIAGYTDLSIDAKSKIIDSVFLPTTWSCAEHFKAFLDSFQHATVMMSAGTYPTLSMVALVHRSLRKHIQTSKEKAAGDEVVLRFMDAVDGKLQAYDQLTVTHEVKIAMALDPRFKRAICRLGFDPLETRRLIHEEFTRVYEADYVASLARPSRPTASATVDQPVSSAMAMFECATGGDDVFESEQEPFSTELERWFSSPALRLDYGCRNVLLWYRANQTVYK